MELGNIDPRILQKLSDPEVQKLLTNLISSAGGDDPTEFAPFYRNKHGKITSGHEGIEKFKKDMELEPIFAPEAVKLGLMTQFEADKFLGKAEDENKRVDLINVSEDELQELRAKARELSIPNAHLMKAHRLRAEIKKAEMKNSPDGE